MFIEQTSGKRLPLAPLGPPVPIKRHKYREGYLLFDTCGHNASVHAHEKLHGLETVMGYHFDGEGWLPKPYDKQTTRAYTSCQDIRNQEEF
jgi:hypothetical protein